MSDASYEAWIQTRDKTTRLWTTYSKHNKMYENGGLGAVKAECRRLAALSPGVEFRAVTVDRTFYDPVVVEPPPEPIRVEVAKWTSEVPRKDGWYLVKDGDAGDLLVLLEDGAFYCMYVKSGGTVLSERVVPSGVARFSGRIIFGDDE